MIGFKFFNWMGNIRKSIKIPIFSKKKNSLAITVLLLLIKTYFFLKAYNSQTKR